MKNLIEKYKQEIKKLELEIEIKPFKDIKHKIAQKATLDYVLKDLIELSERHKSTETSNKHDTKQLNILSVSDLLFDFWLYIRGGMNDTPIEEIKEGVEMFLSNYKR